jgi:hypothetical protein
MAPKKTPEDLTVDNPDHDVELVDDGAPLYAAGDGTEPTIYEY